MTIQSRKFRIIMAAGAADGWRNMGYLVQLFMAGNDMETCRSFLGLLKTVSKL